MSDVTRVLQQIESGDAWAAEQLLPLVYAELRKLAASRMACESPDHTLQATALVHEAYVRLVDRDRVQHWDSRGHFFVAAAEAMRRILIEESRRKQRIRHGGGRRQERLPEIADVAPSDNLLAIDEALSALALEDAAAARTVELRYFAGLGHEQIAETLGVTVYEARQKWTYARAWLKDFLTDSG